MVCNCFRHTNLNLMASYAIFKQRKSKKSFFCQRFIIFTTDLVQQFMNKWIRRSLKTWLSQIRHQTNRKILQWNIQRRKTHHRRSRVPPQPNKILHHHSIQHNLTHLMRHHPSVIDNLRLEFVKLKLSHKFFKNSIHLCTLIYWSLSSHQIHRSCRHPNW